MNELRWILLLVGVLLVAGVFIYTRWQQTRQHKTDNDSLRQEPHYDKTDNFSASDNAQRQDDKFLVDAAVPNPEPRIPNPGAAPSPQPPAPSPDPDLEQTYAGLDDTATQKIITIHVMAPEGSTYPAHEVVEVLQAAGMKYGKYGIFHHDMPIGGAARTVFSAADMVEPGTFDLGKLDEKWLIGITLFMVLPGPRSGVDAFAQMLATARQLADKLGGEVIDASHSTLTRQTAHHMREDIIAFETKTH